MLDHSGPLLRIYSRLFTLPYPSVTPTCHPAPLRIGAVRNLALPCLGRTPLYFAITIRYQTIPSVPSHFLCVPYHAKPLTLPIRAVQSLAVPYLSARLFASPLLVAAILRPAFACLCVSLPLLNCISPYCAYHRFSSPPLPVAFPRFALAMPPYPMPFRCPAKLRNASAYLFPGEASFPGVAPLQKPFKLSIVQPFFNGCFVFF